MQSSLERMRISWNLAEDNAGCVACLLLLCQGSKWLNGRTFDLYSEGVGFESQLDPRLFSVDLYLTLSVKTPLFMYMLCELLVTSSEPDF